MFLYLSCDINSHGTLDKYKQTSDLGISDSLSITGVKRQRFNVLVNIILPNEQLSRPLNSRVYIYFPQKVFILYRFSVCWLKSKCSVCVVVGLSWI